MTWHAKKTFLACHDCGVLQPVAERASGLLNEAADAAAEAYDAFVAAHHTHHTARFHRHDAELLADRPLWDPMASVAFEVGDGEHAYVAIATRDSVSEARIYRFRPGTLETVDSEVEVDDGDLRRGLDREFYPHALRPTKLDRFISVLHDVVRHIPPAELEIAFDLADDPAVSIARMPAETYEELLARCVEIFDPWEWARVNRFLWENRGEDGLLALRVRRHIALLSA